MNSNVVSLIPKILEMDSIVVSNFRFKIIYKILTERLALITSRIIFSNQFGSFEGICWEKS